MNTWDGQQVPPVPNPDPGWNFSVTQRAKLWLVLVGIVILILLGVWLTSDGVGSEPTYHYTGACGRYVEQMTEYGEDSVRGQAAAAMFVLEECESKREEI